MESQYDEMPEYDNICQLVECAGMKQKKRTALLNGVRGRIEKWGNPLASAILDSVEQDCWLKDEPKLSDLECLIVEQVKVLIDKVNADE